MNAKRFDFLMNLTNTKNNTLGRALSFDSSYIGKLRKGTRSLPEKSPFLKNAAGFFADNLKDEYQINSLKTVILAGKPVPKDKKQLSDIIAEWLSNDNDRDTELSFFYTNFEKHEPSADISDSQYKSESGKENVKTHFYYGNEGKQKAVEEILMHICSDGEPHELLLYSDEDMEWLYSDTSFALRWSGLLKEFLKNGGSIRIIHTIIRNIDEMLEAVKKWMPLYASGSIVPYYYPRLRDGVYHRSLFISPGCAAMVSSSIGDHTEDMANMLTFDLKAVNAFIAEFNNLAALCRPLMSIYRSYDFDRFAEYLSNALLSDDMLYFASSTGTQEIAWTISSLLSDSANIVSLSMLDERLRNNNRTKLIISDRINENMIIIAADNHGASIVYTGNPPIVFSMDEQNISSAILEYILRLF